MPLALQRLKSVFPFAAGKERCEPLRSFPTKPQAQISCIERAPGGLPLGLHTEGQARWGPKRQGHSSRLFFSISKKCFDGFVTRHGSRRDLQKLF